jgi:hypothetical protein
VAGLLLSACIAAPAMAADGTAAGSPLSASIDAAAAASASASSAPVDVAAPDDAQDPTPAPSPEAMAMSFLKATEISGFVDMYYMYNFNKTAPVYRNFDTSHNSFSLNLAEIALEKKPTADSRAGFRIDLDYGPTATLIHSLEPVAGQAAIFQNIEQAYLSYLVHTGSGLQLDFGKFVTPAGYEVIESKDNANYSRGLLFALAIPYYHMGARATYSPSDKITLAAYLVNGWNNSVDNNSGKTFIGSITLKAGSAFSFIENYIGGPEITDTNKGMRNLSDTVATFTATKALSFAGNLDYGEQGSYTPAGTGTPTPTPLVVAVPSQTWWGVAGYAKWQANDVFAISPRLEYLDDQDGFMTGTVQKLKEFTLTLESKTKEGFIARAEYRHDMSDTAVYQKTGPKKSQDTFTLGLIYAFSSMH